jgi:hypothetical protein
MAMGAGAFLVQVCRYLSERLLEAWVMAEEARAGRLTVGGQADAANRAAYAELRREADELLAGRRPFHWPLEFPEVFVSIEDGSDGDVLRQWGIDPRHPNILITNRRIAENSATYAATSPGFAAIVGNPPFMGGQKITGRLGISYRDYLVHLYATGYNAILASSKNILTSDARH